MSPKLKSLLFLLCFILCVLLYNHFEENKNKESSIKSSHFDSEVMIDMNESENLNSEQDAIKEDVVTE